VSVIVDYTRNGTMTVDFSEYFWVSDNKEVVVCLYLQLCAMRVIVNCLKLTLAVTGVM